MSLNQPLQFAYWVPNVSGGLVISQIAYPLGCRIQPQTGADR